MLGVSCKFNENRPYLRLPVVMCPKNYFILMLSGNIFFHEEGL